MKAFHHSFAQTTYSQQQYGYGQQQIHQSEPAKEAEAAFDSILTEEQENLEDLPGVGLSSFGQAPGEFNSERRSAGVHDVMAERQRRLLDDGLRTKLGGASQTAIAGTPTPTSAPRGRTRLDAYRERFQSQSSPVASTSQARSAFEARLEARLDTLMELHGISDVVEKQPEISLPSSPWDISSQRADNAQQMGFSNHNFSTMRLPSDLPRVGR